MLCEVKLPLVAYQLEAELRIVGDKEHEDRGRSRCHANAECEAQRRAFAAGVGEPASGEG